VGLSATPAIPRSGSRLVEDAPQVEWCGAACNPESLGHLQLADPRCSSGIVSTKILLPNAEAANPASRQFYDSIGLNEREIDIVQKSIPKRQYYIVSPNGRRLIALGLGGVALSFVAISGREELQLAEDVIDQHGDRWRAEWLRMRGLGDWAAYHDNGNELNTDKRRIA
jgi:hypothetical protein